MRRVWLGFTLALLTAATAAAQGRQLGREPQAERGGFYDRMIRQLAEELELTDEQRPQFDEIVAAFREENAAQDDPRAIFEEMRAARDAGDDARLEELRDEMRQRGGRMREQGDKLMAELEPILTDVQKQRMDEFRATAGRRMMGGMNRERGAAMIGELRTALNLTPEQQERFDQLAAKLREQADAREAGREELRRAARDLREADEQGADESERAELQARLDQLRTDLEGGQRPFDEFAAELAPTLDEEQKATLEKMRGEFVRGGPGGPGGPDGRRGASRDDPRTLFRAVRRLDLSAEQQEEIEAIEREFRESSRPARDADDAGPGRARPDRDAARAANEKIKADVLSVLDDEQKAELERVLQTSDRRLGDRMRDRRDERRGQRGPEGEPPPPPPGDDEP